MRRLAEPRVMKSAAVAAVITSLLCYPRFALWEARVLPIWYLLSMVFLGTFVLWAFVFAWHTEYSGRPLFTRDISPRLFMTATVLGLITATVLYFALDPILRQRAPEEFPGNVQEWIAFALFDLSFVALFLMFAPFAWVIRLVGKVKPAMVLTILIGLIVLVLKVESSPAATPASLLIGMMLGRVVMGVLALWFYLRGGLPLAWWWGLLLESRHLVGAAGEG